jgi:site-specific recombinase XerD
MERRRSQLRMGRRLKIIQQQVGHSWASTTAVYTTVGADARNRMLTAALARAFEKDKDDR